MSQRLASPTPVSAGPACIAGRPRCGPPRDRAGDPLRTRGTPDAPDAGAPSVAIVLHWVRYAIAPQASATTNEPMDSAQRLRTPRSNCRSCRREHGTCAKAPFRQARCRRLGAKRSKLRSRQCLRGFLKGYEAALSMRGNRLPRDREGRALLPPGEPPEEVARIVDRRGDVASARGLSGQGPCQRILLAGWWTLWSEHGENRGAFSWSYRERIRRTSPVRSTARSRWPRRRSTRNASAHPTRPRIECPRHSSPASNRRNGCVRSPRRSCATLPVARTRARHSTGRRRRTRRS